MLKIGYSLHLRSKYGNFEISPLALLARNDKEEYRSK